MGYWITNSRVRIPNLWEEQPVPEPGHKRFDVEGHVVDQVGVGMSEPFFVSCKDKFVKVVAELIDKPLMFTLNATRCTDRCGQKDNVTDAAQLRVEFFKPSEGDEVGPEFHCAQGG